MLLKSSLASNPAQRPQQQLALALLHRAAGDLDVLGDHRVAHLRDRQAVGVQLLDVDDDVDLAGAGAGDGDWPTPLTVWIARDTCLSAISVSVRRLIASDDDHQRDHRIGVGIDLGDHRRQQLRRNHLDRRGHFLADVVGGVVQVALEDEAHRDRAAALVDAGRQLVDAGDAADRLFHRLDDRGGNLVRARPGQRQRHVHRRGIGARKQIDAEIAEGEDPEHHQRHHQHRGEDRPTDADF